ncbi:hypothetical protein BKA67DRAFT_417346 [Truncatella angustata]|uniref:MADS-box domain-containing protein n=1 Tax=Truncatella angustata TaxID=152316 RepID=A0A9P8RJ47_9PEZI|nr:uncharacterized protein BKA67DRAFT_417346 [Truncatella angustata]KAH6646827.1 hypothetical protein BKA67DRAFT_417346 [Truncatella angustata]
MERREAKVCRRALLARARRRRQTLFKKADELRSECDAEVYIVIHKHGRFFTYTSTDNPAWPPSKEHIEMSYPLPIAIGPSSQEVAVLRTRRPGIDEE